MSIEQRQLLRRTMRGAALLGALFGVTACPGDEVDDKADEAMEELRDEAMDAREEIEDGLDELEDEVDDRS